MTRMSHNRGIIEVDVPCIRCAYPLRGQPGHGQCPDCGTDISRSLHLAAMRSEDPDVLQRIVRGIALQSWGTVLGLLACIIGPTLIPNDVSWFVLGGTLAAILGGIGYVLLRSGWFTDDAGRLRKTSELLPILTAGIFLVVAGLVIRLPIKGDAPLMMVIVFMAAAGLWFLHHIEQLRLLEEFAAEVDEQLVRNARSLRAGLRCVIILLSVGVLLPMLHAHMNVHSMHIGRCLLCSSAVALTVLVLLTTLLFDRVGSALRQRVQYARTVRRDAGLSPFAPCTLSLTGEFRHFGL